MLLSAVLSAAALFAVVPMQKLGAYVMQAGETSPVNWKGRTLLVEATTGDTIDLQGRPTYACCKCRTFGCVANASAPIGYVDCSGCAGTCTAAQKKAWGSCAPEFIRVRDLKTLETLQKIPGSEGFGFANAFVHGGRLWAYGDKLPGPPPPSTPMASRTRTALMNHSRGTSSAPATEVHVFSTDDPVSGKGVWRTERVLQMPAGYDVYNVDVAAVADGVRKFVMSIEVNLLAGKRTSSWAVIFAGTTAATPDAGWALVDPPNHNVDLSRMTACPAVRWFAGWYYVATTTDGAPCKPGGWTGKSASLCVLLYRSKTLAKGSWVMGNNGQPIVQPGDSGANNDRKIMPQFNATPNEKKAIYGHAPQVLGNINDSDFDLCDAPDMGGVFGLWGGIANQQSNPYFSIGGVAKGVTVQQYFEQYFKNSGTH